MTTGLRLLYYGEIVLNNLVSTFRLNGDSSMNQAKLVKRLDQATKRVLFLGYTQEQTSLVDELVKANCEVWHTQEKIETTEGFDFVISYGYRHILKKPIIESSKGSPTFQVGSLRSSLPAIM